MFDASLATVHAGHRKNFSLASAFDSSDNEKSTSSTRQAEEEGDEMSSTTLTGNSRAGDWSEKRSLFNVRFDPSAVGTPSSAVVYFFIRESFLDASAENGRRAQNPVSRTCAGCSHHYSFCLAL